ncbi:type I-G CRISPR-associated protein Cas8g2 [Zobellella sp. An-6]|uniref:type I-G CRISPR-associated protein Cas8g2 n=1 Tax=Zobellella sp. An-6 TaxID=3400218 RepID=UPI004041F611
MAESTIPVDLFNPGQVFACLGFMELADVLLGDAMAGFNWRNKAKAEFHLSATEVENPFEVVLDFLASATVERITPVGYVELPKKKAGAEDGDDDEDDDESELDVAAGAFSETFPAKEGDTTSLPVRLLVADRAAIEVSHWADGSARDTFKLYAGNRSAEKITKAMVNGVRKKPTKKQTIGDLKYQGIKQLWAEKKDDLVANPFDVLTPLGGSFNFDPRGAWTALDAGYSPNTQKHGVAASPLVHLLAACGLEHTRPVEFGVRQVRYCVWSGLLPVSLARVAFQGHVPSLLTKHFRFELALSGKNKIVTFAQQENNHEHQ